MSPLMERFSHFESLTVNLSAKGFAVVTLNRPSKGNALNDAMWKEIPQVKNSRSLYAWLCDQVRRQPDLRTKLTYAASRSWSCLESRVTPERYAWRHYMCSCRFCNWVLHCFAIHSSQSTTVGEALQTALVTSIIYQQGHWQATMHSAPLGYMGSSVVLPS